MSSTPTDFNDMINVHGKSRAFELINQIVNDGIARIQRGEIAGTAPASEGVGVIMDGPPDIEAPPPEFYANEPDSGIKIAQEAAPGGDDASKKNSEKKKEEKKKKRIEFGDWRDGLRRNKDFVIQSWAYNVAHILQHDKEFTDALEYCELSYRILKRRPLLGRMQPGEWTDSDTAHLMVWFGKKYYFNPGDKIIVAGLVVAARQRSIHPVREYLRSLVWDKTPRIDTWLEDCFDATPKNENESNGCIYLSLVGRYFLIGAVARAMESPVKMDNVLILEGYQGKGKSTAVEILFSPKWFSDSPVPIGEKDAYQVIQGKWCVELGELDSFNKAESTSAKTFFSSKTDRYRASYGHMVNDWPRQCVFVGTTNQDEYLKDYTGNRRYWPVYCRVVNKQWMREHRDQLWAEAMHYYQLEAQLPTDQRSQPSRWWPDESQRALFEAEQDARLQLDPWQTLIEDYLAGITAEYVTSAAVLTDAVGKLPGQITKADQGRISPIMHTLGWQNKRKRITLPGTTVSSPRHVYVRPAGTGGDNDGPF